jgi:asparagine synthase (glutamine-hydrolysing)
MSVQTGIRYFDERTACRGEVVQLLQNLEQKGPDYCGIHVTGPVGMGFLGFNITPEDRNDQPLATRHGTVITFDGRLDNRPEVGRRLGMNRPTISDGDLALAAFDAMGTSAFELLAGEFAFVILDAMQRALFLVRSRCGTRALFYTSDRSRVIWSSELDQLMIKSDVDPAINNGYAIGYLYYQPDIDESPFKNVAVVPAGSYVEFTANGETRGPTSTWRPERIATLALSSDQEYEESCREELEIAITRRLRTRQPVFSELSGGVDSSTVVLVADQALKKSGRGSDALTTISCTYQKSMSCDETAFIEAVEQRRGRPGIHLPEESQQATLGLNNIEFTGVPNTTHCFPGRYRVTEELMRGVGARVLLTGIGGDHLFWSDHTGSPELADLLSKGKLPALLSRARKWSQAAALPLWQVLVTSAVGPITTASRLFHWHPSDLNFRPWMTEQARRWITSPGRSQALRLSSEIQLPSLRVRAQAIRSLYALIGAGYFQECHGIFFSHPLASQRLIDFVLSLPIDQLARPGEDRSLLRRTMAGVLPQKVRSRKSKGSIDEMFCRVMQRDSGSVSSTEQLEVCRRGFAEPQALRRSIREVALGRLDQSYALVRLFSLERWLRSLQTIAARRLAYRHTEKQRPPVLAIG